MPEPHHAAFENVLNGGIIGTVLDYHMNWTTIFHLMKKQGLDHAPCCVTAEFKVVLKRPTQMGPVHVDAHVVASGDDRATIEAIMTAGGKVTAIGTGTFVAVKPATRRTTAGSSTRLRGRSGDIAATDGSSGVGGRVSSRGPGRPRHAPPAR